MEEDWRNCEELGTGGFGVVYKQAQGTTGRYGAVMVIDRRRLPPNFDCSRELLVKTILAKVCIRVPKGICPGLLPIWDFLVVV